MNKPSNRKKFVIHGFFYTSAISVAEPSTILPLVVSFFTSSTLLVGVYSSLLRGGAVVMQLYAAFMAQSYGRVINRLRLIFLFRFIAWFSIGVSIYFFGNSNGTLTLWLIGIGLFAFSFSSGWGTIYFQELLGKCFTPEYRGATMAYRQFFSNMGGILSGAMAGYILGRFPEPFNFAYLFLISTFLMMCGYFFLGTVVEKEKKNTSVREKKFTDFLVNSYHILRSDKKLGFQIFLQLIAYTYLFVHPFIIIHGRAKIDFSYWMVGSLVPLLMTGAMLSNLLWGRMALRLKNTHIITTSYVLMIISVLFSVIGNHYWYYAVLYLFSGASADGFRLAFNNLLFDIAPENKRPVYIAIQNNLTSLGLFFSIPGGLLISFLGFEAVAFFVLVLLLGGLTLSIKKLSNYR
jgi:MFS family permease